MRGGEQMGTRDWPGLVLGADNSSLASLAESSSNMSLDGSIEDVGEYTQVWVCVQREPLVKASRGASTSTWLSTALATCLWPSAGAGMPWDATLQELVVWSEAQLKLPRTLAGLQ